MMERPASEATRKFYKWQDKCTVGWFFLTLVQLASLGVSIGIFFQHDQEEMDDLAECVVVGNRTTYCFYEVYPDILAMILTGHLD